MLVESALSSELDKVGADQGCQLISKPFVRLNVEAVQNAAALRYQTW